MVTFCRTRGEFLKLSCGVQFPFSDFCSKFDRRTFSGPRGEASTQEDVMGWEESARVIWHLEADSGVFHLVQQWFGPFCIPSKMGHFPIDLHLK